MQVPLLLLLAAPSAAALSGSESSAAEVMHMSLGGSHWKLSSSNVSNVSATVPGQVHTDLLAAGMIAEPFFGAGDATLEWVAMSDWDYTASFTLPDGMLAKQHVQLVSLGIDTVADIFINGKHVFFSDNMFHRVRLDVKRFLKAGSNDIRVHFTSKPLEANRRAAACDNATAVICPAGEKNPCQHPYDNVNYLRTEPCSFSWDWGPAFAPVGLWRPLYLQAYDSAVVRDITVVTTPHAAAAAAAAAPAADDDGLLIPRWGKHYDASDSFAADDQSEAAVIARAFRRTDRELDLTLWDLEATVYLDAGVSDSGSGSDTNSDTNSDSESRSAIAGEVVVSINTVPPVTASVAAVVGGAAGAETRVSVQIKGVKADAWFPNGFGEQPLYVLSAKFVPRDNTAEEEEAGAGAPEPFEVPYPLQDDAIKGMVRNGLLYLAIVVELKPTKYHSPRQAPQDWYQRRHAIN
jgi:hypothetical protein